MSNFQTIKNSLRKLESKQQNTDNRRYYGVITIEVYNNIELSKYPFGRAHERGGYLVVPRKLTEAEWELKYGF